MTPASGRSGLASLIEPGCRLDRVAGGFEFTEGPIWTPAEGALYFSDIPGDRRWRWHPVEGISVAREPNNMGNGMALTDDGSVVVCEHATSRVVLQKLDGSESSVLASHWQGKELNSPNDVIVAGDGSVLFTDPTYGRMPYYGIPRPCELPIRGLYRVPPDRSGLELLVDDFAQPNGLCLAAGDRLLYVNDTERALVRVFEVGHGWSLRELPVFASALTAVPNGADGFVDGMKLDERGNVYVTGPGGIWVYTPDGVRLGAIEVPEKVGNLNWGDDDWRTLYITASTSVYRIRLSVAGNRLGYMS